MKQELKKVIRFEAVVTANGVDLPLQVNLTYNLARDTYSIVSKITTKHVGFSSDERHAMLNTQDELLQEAIETAQTMQRESTTYGDNLFTGTSDDTDQDEPLKVSGGKVKKLPKVAEY
jgi:hypothetical protein